MLKTVITALAIVLTASFMAPDVSMAAKKKKDVRDSMSAEQKKERRRKAREWCQKKYANDGSNYIERVQIMSDGRVMCYIRGY